MLYKLLHFGQVWTEYFIFKCIMGLSVPPSPGLSSGERPVRPRHVVGPVIWQHAGAHTMTGSQQGVK